MENLSARVAAALVFIWGIVSLSIVLMVLPW
jgi:hypothetical protein